MFDPVSALEAWCDSKTTDCPCGTCVAEPVSPVVEAYRAILNLRRKSLSSSGTVRTRVLDEVIELLAAAHIKEEQ